MPRFSPTAKMLVRRTRAAAQKGRLAVLLQRFRPSKISISTVPSKKKDTTYVVSFFLGSAGRWPAPPFGISNARLKRTLPLPRSCLRQKHHPPAPLLLHALPRPGPWQTQFEDPLLRSLANEKDLLRSLRAVTSQCDILPCGVVDALSAAGLPVIPGSVTGSPMQMPSGKKQTGPSRICGSWMVPFAAGETLCHSLPGLRAPDDPCIFPVLSQLAPRCSIVLHAYCQKSGFSPSDSSLSLTSNNVILWVSPNITTASRRLRA